MATKSLIAVDKTADLYQNEVHFVGNQQYRIGEVGLFKGRKFVLLPGHQYSDPFSREGGELVNVFKFRALMLNKEGEFTGVVDGVTLTDLVRTTYCNCERNEEGKLKPYPKVGMTLSKNGNLIPENFGDVTLNCGWDARKVFVGTENEQPLFDFVIDKPQAFEVKNVELHYLSVYDEAQHKTSTDDEGYVLMRPRLVAIIERIEMPKGLNEAIKEATK